MSVRTPKIGQVVSYRNAAGETTDIVVQARQEAAPPAPSTSTSTSGGTLAASTYSYRITAVISGIETTASEIKTQTTTGTTSTVTVDWTSIAETEPYSGATAFKVYGRTGGSQLLIGTVNMPTTTFVDTGSVTPSGAQPTDTGTVKGKAVHLKQFLTMVRATTSKQTDRYYAR